MKVLTQRQINNIKNWIAAADNRLTIDISDQEVFERVTEKMESYNDEVGFKTNKWITWAEAVGMCFNEYGSEESLSYC